MPIVKFLEYNNSFTKTLEKLWKYCADGPNNIIVYSESKSNLKFTGNINAGDTRK